MAKRSRRARTRTASADKAAVGGDRARSAALARLDEDFRERRFEPKTSQRELLGVVMMSLGGVALGIGVYGRFVREEPIEWAPYVIALGAVLIIAYLLFGRGGDGPLYVGDLGIGMGRDGKITRTRWYELHAVSVGGAQLRLETRGKPVLVSLAAHTPAARRIVHEAMKRIPKRTEIDDADLERLGLGDGGPRSGEGQTVIAEAPQVTLLRCLASDEPLTFEKDVRMCRRCTAFYHRLNVPRRCVECGKKLKAS